MVCDSTNVFVDGEAGSEAEVRVALNALIGRLKGKVAVACFASNVARHGHHHPRRPGQRPPGLPGRPLDAPHGRGGQVGGPS